MTEDQQERLTIQDSIDEFGCQIMQVAGDNYLPSFAYTIGLHQQHNHPEIICFGLSEEVMEALLNNAKERIEDGIILEANKKYKDFLSNGVEVYFLPVDKAYLKDYMGYAEWFYGEEEFDVLQLVWPDKKGKFPWQSSFDKKLDFIQPLLDRDVDFRFYESKKLGVFTTQNILDKKEPVRYVIHDEEGDWFFLENEDVDNDDIQIISLEQIVTLDPTLNSIYHLQYGWEAYRASTDSEWTETESEYEEEEEE